jgi:RNA polymerase sigma-70 factor (ECF subfamily)
MLEMRRFPGRFDHNDRTGSELKKTYPPLSVWVIMNATFLRAGATVSKAIEPAVDELVARAVACDEGALAALLKEIGPQVHRRLRIGRKWQAALDAADVMQVTYLEAFLRVQDLDASTMAQFTAWITRIAENNLRDAIRELERLKRGGPGRPVHPTPQSDSSVTLLESAGWTSTTPSRDAAAEEARKLVHVALRRLPEVYREVLRLSDLEGRKPTEVADALGRSVGAVHMLRARARDRLREILGSPSRFFSDSP